MSKQQTKHLRSLIIQYFQCISSGQNIIQCIKQTLFLHPNFNPLTLFDIISNGQQLQSNKNWYIYLTRVNIQFQEQQLSFLFQNNNFHERIRFNQFLEALLPYNADVLRIFRKTYLQQIQNQKIDQEVLCIFNQLVKFWIKFFKNLIEIKKQINACATQSQILELVKQDLIYENKNRNNVRQAMKYKQKFQQNKQFQLTFNELRRFLSLWTVPEQTNLEFQLLHIKRYLKHDYPFRHICSKTSQIGHSALKRKSNSVQKIKRNKQSFNSFHTNFKNRQPKYQQFSSENRYRDFKSELFRQLIDRQSDYKNKQLDSSNKIQSKFQKINLGVSSQDNQRQLKSNKKQYKNLSPKKLFFEQNSSRQQYLRDIRYARNKKGIDGEYIIQIFEQISTKQQRLQKLRKKMVNNHDFNLINLFKLIDDNNLGYISQNSIQQYVNSRQNITFRHLISFHARQKQILRFQDFCMIFRPLSKKLNEILDEKLQNRLPNPFKKDTIKTISEILTLSAELFNNLYQIRCKINDKGIKTLNLFKYVDVKNKGYIEAQDIKDLLDQKNIECDTSNLKCVMKLFKKRVNQKIYSKQLEEFLDL